MNPTFVEAALGLSRRIGLRTDCLGEHNMFSLIPSSSELQQVWKRAPVISEWCGTTTTSPSLGAQQVRQFHVSQISSGNRKVSYALMTPREVAGWRDAVKRSGYRYTLRSLTLPRVVHGRSTVKVSSVWTNLGSAPTYDAWQARLEFRRRDGSVAGHAPLGIDLRRVLPGTRSHAAKVAVPGLAAGRYTLALSVHSIGGYLAPMSLALTSRAGDRYVLGRIKVPLTPRSEVA